MAQNVGIVERNKLRNTIKVKKNIESIFFSVILNKSLQRTNRSISKEYGIDISNDIQISRAKEHILY